MSYSLATLWHERQRFLPGVLAVAFSALLIALQIGLLLGLSLGALQLFYSLEVARRDLIGIDMGYAYPFQMALALAPIILGAAFLAALAPAETAVRGSLVEALEYE